VSVFAIPESAIERPAPVDPAKCRAQAPDLWTVECQLDHGHDGPHRNNQTLWHDQTTPDLHVETERWQNGRVLLFDDVEPRPVRFVVTEIEGFRKPIVGNGVNVGLSAHVIDTLCNRRLVAVMCPRPLDRGREDTGSGCAPTTWRSLSVGY
jgi:hypothetical protein